MSIEIIRDEDGKTVAAIVDLKDGSFAVIGARGLPSEIHAERWQAEREADDMLTRARGLAALKRRD